MLTRKDFIILAKKTAKILNAVDTEEKEGAKEIIKETIIDFCRQQNSLFSKERFEKAVNKYLEQY